MVTYIAYVRVQCILSSYVNNVTYQCRDTQRSVRLDQRVDGGKTEFDAIKMVHDTLEKKYPAFQASVT